MSLIIKAQSYKFVIYWPTEARVDSAVKRATDFHLAHSWFASTVNLTNHPQQYSGDGAPIQAPTMFRE